MITNSTGLHLTITDPPQTLERETGLIGGVSVVVSRKKLKDLQGLFADRNAYTLLDPETLVYSVQAHMPVDEGTPGGLFFGNTIVEPGKVGNEYFITHGHFHANADRAEYYWGVKGEGILILMDLDRKTWGERVFPGSLHYIPGNVAHRLANTGPIPLTVGACWHSDAGHNYDEIDMNGFSARLYEVEGSPRLVEVCR